VHVHTYPEGNQRRWVGIARSGDWSNSFWVSTDLDRFRRTAQDLFDEKSRRLVTVDTLGDEAFLPHVRACSTTGPSSRSSSGRRP
jgi:hypothetical protein